MKFFNTGGPCIPERHYMLPAVQRLDAFDIDRLIQQWSYFVVHAPRQTGKTTAMLELARKLTASGDYISVVLSMEVGSPFADQILKAESAIVREWKSAIREQLPTEFHPSIWMPEAIDGSLIGVFLSEWSFDAARPLIIFLDEIDALEDQILISVLRQLRSGYYRRPKGFPAALAVIGLRDVRDYKVKTGGQDRLKSPSPFNIAVRSITLRNFTADEVNSLLQQHTDETGQIFSPEARERIYHLTEGQPWLVNSLAKVCVEELVRDESQPILSKHVNDAKETLILRRHTHLDSLADKLQEPRVRQVIEPLMAGTTPEVVPRDDIDYVIALGLVKQENGGGFRLLTQSTKRFCPASWLVFPKRFCQASNPHGLTQTGRSTLKNCSTPFSLSGDGMGNHS